MFRRIVFAALAALSLSCLVVGATLAQDGGIQPDRLSSHMTVNTPADVDERDGVLSLREALLLAQGLLHEEDLDEAEQAQVIGVPGADSTDIIRFDRTVFPYFYGPPIYVGDAPLPPLAYGFDTIDARYVGVTLVGRQGYGPGLLVTSNYNQILGVKMVGFFGDAIAIVDSRNNEVRDVQLYDNGTGVRITGYLARDNRVRRSDIERNRDAGVWIDFDADRNTIQDNDLKYSTAGIRFGPGTSGNVAKDNDISFNVYGVFIERGAGRNDFDDNKFRGNRVDVKYE